LNEVLCPCQLSLDGLELFFKQRQRIPKLVLIGRDHDKAIETIIARVTLEVNLLSRREAGDCAQMLGMGCARITLDARPSMCNHSL